VRERLADFSEHLLGEVLSLVGSHEASQVATDLGMKFVVEVLKVERTMVMQFAGIRPTYRVWHRRFSTSERLREAATEKRKDDARNGAKDRPRTITTGSVRNER
jgi:hypothetical protein